MEPDNDPIQQIGSGMKFLMGSIGSAFMIGAIFWAGATYNRVDAIEGRLANIEMSIAKVGNIQLIDERTVETQKRLDKLEDQMRQQQSR